MEYLIPEQWFEGLDFWRLFLIGGAATAVLLMGADRLVEGASGIAVRLGMPKVIVGATIVSLGTTSPEAAVSVMAAWGGNAGLALGNGIGSIIFDSGLIFGVGCLMTRLPADRFVLARQAWVQFGAGLLLAVICYGLFISHGLAANPRDGVEFLRAAKLAEIGRGVGIFLVVLLVGYLFVSVRWARQHPVGEPFVAPEDFEEAEGVIPHARRPHGVVSTQLVLDWWPAPTFDLLGLMSFTRVDDRLELRSPRMRVRDWVARDGEEDTAPEEPAADTVAVREIDESGVTSHEGWRFNLLIFAVSKRNHILSQEL